MIRKAQPIPLFIYFHFRLFEFHRKDTVKKKSKTSNMLVGELFYFPSTIKNYNNKQ